MSVFDDLKARVVQISNRPDLAAEITICIQDATTQLHKLDYFYKDIIEGVIDTTGTGLQEVTVPLNTFDNFRSVKDIIPVVPSSGNPFSPCVIPKLISNPNLAYCRCHSNWWRVLGRDLTINTNQRVTQFTLYYYSTPVVNPTSAYNSWIAEQYPEAIIDLTLMKLYSMLRDYSAANLYSSKVGSRDNMTGHVAVIIGDNINQEIQ